MVKFQKPHATCFAFAVNAIFNNEKVDNALDKPFNVAKKLYLSLKRAEKKNKQIQARCKNLSNNFSTQSQQ